MAFRDNWPKMSDGRDFDGKQLLALVLSGKSPFHGAWDVNLLIREIEEKLEAQVIDIPMVYNGSNNYVRPCLRSLEFDFMRQLKLNDAQGFHIKLLNQPDIMARLARGDVNMPNYDGFPIHVQIPEVKFEVAVYQLLRSEPQILTSRLLYHRIPVQDDGARDNIPQHIAGRRLLVFEKSEGENNVWSDLNSEHKACLLAQSACIRASLFNFSLPLDFATFWLRERLFEQKPEFLPIPVAPTRGFCVALFASKIEATIGNVGDMIGWEDDDNTVGIKAAAAKQSLLRLIRHVMPADSHQNPHYRLVLDHGDFGIHNMSITMDADGQPLVTSLYDWETGCIVPAMLSDPLMAVTVDLVTDADATPSFTRVPQNAASHDRAQYMRWSKQYFKVLFDQAPDYEHGIREGRDARYVWFALRDWRGENPEGYFGALGAWAERRMKELGVD